MARTEVGPDTDAPGPGGAEHDEPLLGRLNRLGFRLIMLLDAVSIFAIALGTMVFRYELDWPSYSVGLYLFSFVVTTGIFMAALYFGGLYEREPRLGAPPVLPRSARQTLAAGGLVALLNLAATGLARELGVATERALPMPITNLVVLIVLGAAAVAANRAVANWVRTRREGPPRVMLVGSETEIALARSHLALDRERARIVGQATTVDDLPDRSEEDRVTDVVILSGTWLDALYPSVLEQLEARDVSVLLRVGARETMYGLERIREVGGMPFVLLRSQTMVRSRARFKRAFDLFLLSLGSPALLLLVGFVALHQRIAVGRPLLYWQERVGAGGRPFPMVKFRTMVVDAEAEGGARLAERDDPRVVPACRWIRSMRFDELPQLWHVLKGEMSLVGPRPERPELAARFERAIPGYGRRHEVPPGLTGLAQIHGRYHTDAEYKLGYDLQYLVNWSPVLDLEILLRTVWVVLARRL
jgi:exopolysaccharide biosynthesis polyprenyl glycosylphosphotransferase